MINEWGPEPCVQGKNRENKIKGRYPREGNLRAQLHRWNPNLFHYFTWDVEKHKFVVRSKEMEIKRRGGLVNLQLLADVADRK